MPFVLSITLAGDEKRYFDGTRFQANRRRARQYPDLDAALRAKLDLPVEQRRSHVFIGWTDLPAGSRSAAGPARHGGDTTITAVVRGPRRAGRPKKTCDTPASDEAIAAAMPFDQTDVQRLIGMAGRGLAVGEIDAPAFAFDLAERIARFVDPALRARVQEARQLFGSLDRDAMEVDDFASDAGGMTCDQAGRGRAISRSDGC